MPVMSEDFLEATISMIDSMFPRVDTLNMALWLRLSSAYAAQIAAILTLLNRIPINSIREGAIQAEYLASIAVLTSKLKQWETNSEASPLEWVSGLGDRHPVGLIRRTLAVSLEDAQHANKAITAPATFGCQRSRPISETVVTVVTSVVSLRRMDS